MAKSSWRCGHMVATAWNEIARVQRFWVELAMLENVHIQGILRR